MNLQRFSGMRLVNILLGSWTVLVLLFLYLPIFLLIVYSFNEDRLNVRWTGFTFDWYRKLTTDTPLMRSVGASLWVAFWTTLLSVALGTIGGWLLYRYTYPLMRTLSTLIYIPMIIPEIIMGISLLIYFAMVSDAGNTLMGWLHLPEKFGLGYTTVIISHVTFCFPFVLIAVQARLTGLDPSLEEAAMDLGATPLEAFRHIMIPYLLPAIVSGALMSFTLSMDELIVTYFTTGPESQTLPIVVFGRVKKGLNPSLNAISTIFVVATALLVVLAEYIRKISSKTATPPGT